MKHLKDILQLDYLLQVMHIQQLFNTLYVKNYPVKESTNDQNKDTIFAQANKKSASSIFHFFHGFISFLSLFI